MIPLLVYKEVRGEAGFLCLFTRKCVEKQDSPACLQESAWRSRIPLLVYKEVCAEAGILCLFTRKCVEKQDSSACLKGSA
jgi:hypothetical protein